jgi:hypothetical protein
VTSAAGVEAYLGVVAAGLPGPRRARDDILAELRSGLLDAIEARRCAGLPARSATEAAISEFGDPRQVARSLRPHLAMTEARRTALTLAATGPVVGLLWTLAALASHVAIRHAPPWHWAGAPPLSPAAFPAAGTATLIVVTATLATIAVTGPLTRWLPASPRTAAATAATAGIGAAVADLAILALLASQLASAPATLAPFPVAAAAAASVTRLTLARRAAGRCLAIRSTLT